MNITASTVAYEDWLRSHLDGEIVADDLHDKDKKMRKDAFTFLRATYWRWAEEILELCPDLSDAPPVLAVGDLHVENFGTWRDAEGRLVFGVNDFDEAAEMPYILDPLRLAASAALAGKSGLSIKDICTHILDGYAEGLEAPRPLVLDQHDLQLRRMFTVGNKKRAKFWSDMDRDRNAAARNKSKKGGAAPRAPAPRFVRALKSARPEPSVKFVYWPRTAGAGSLGRPRWIGFGLWREASLVREAKALVPSAWTRAHGGGRRLRCVEIANGAYRSPDPWYALSESILVRRLSPNNRKLELDKATEPSTLLRPRVLRAMGRDLAAVHLGTPDRQAAIARDLEKRRKILGTCVEAAVEFTHRDFAEWKKRG
jgi:uncharacterized protein (DUF2252 family)